MQRIKRPAYGNRFASNRIQSVDDVFSPTSPADVTLLGMLGKRCEASIIGWLLKKNEDSLLLCYTNRPGWYGYQGEHVGKWIDAATLAWANSRNDHLRAKLDRVVNALLAAQLPDGYLGTYARGSHWSIGRDVIGMFGCISTILSGCSPMQNSPAIRKHLSLPARSEISSLQHSVHAQNLI